MTFRICIILTMTINIGLGISPATDRLTWVLENLPVWFMIPVLLLTRRTFPLTNFCIIFLTFHAIILMIGGYYSYAEVPLFNWLRDHFHLHRNHYDRLGHFVQGFVPAILVRELLVRTSKLRQGFWLTFLTIATCLAFSASYELIEWASALTFGDQATSFLGSQGDVWDAQWDMFLALIGSTTSVMLLSRVHNRALQSLA